MNTLQTDILVVGTGIAGLSFALRAAEFAKVMMATKKEQSASNTNYAQGGIASVLAPTDSVDQHVADTLAAGAGLCREEVVREIVQEGPEAVRDLMAWGVAFSREGGESTGWHLGLEGGHSRPRVVHAGDFTGREIEGALLERARAHRQIEIHEHHMAIRLLVGPAAAPGKQKCYGADIMASGSEPVRVWARAVLLATGGAGQVYQHTTNPSIATGDGIALAYRAGTPVANLEFMQFHPTSLYRPGQRTFLISEAVRGEGAQLRNGSGTAFMAAYDSRADLAPRDIVARAIDQEMKESGAPYVYLDITHRSAADLMERFPNIYAHLQDAGLDMARDRIPVVPAAHYLCGGVQCGLDGTTEIEGLLVSGEAACTGMHGANRLASNSLLEAVVISRRAALHLGSDLPVAGTPGEAPPLQSATSSPPGVLVAHLKRDARQIMWDYVGIVRSGERLDWARRSLARLRGEVDLLQNDAKSTYEIVELENILTCAQLMVESACLRRESRGLHYNTDAPVASDHQPGEDTVLRCKDHYVTA